MRKKITVKDLQNFKGKKKLVCILVKNTEEALAADKVGFEMLATGVAGEYKNDDGHPEFDELVKMREAAPTAFMHCGAPDSLIPTLDEAKKFSFKSLQLCGPPAPHVISVHLGGPRTVIMGQLLCDATIGTFIPFNISQTIDTLGAAQ